MRHLYSHEGLPELHSPCLGTVDATGPDRLAECRHAVISLHLLGPGPRHSWLLPGTTYRLTHDGTGWRVWGEAWLEQDAYRLADKRGLVAHVPVEDEVATVVLMSDREYELRHLRLGTEYDGVVDRWNVFVR